MRALSWQGVNDLAITDVPEPRLRNEQDALVKVLATTTCGSDLHLVGGYIPAMRKGDVLGHEFLGEVVEVGPQVRRHRVGDRVVVSSFIGCGRCWYCEHELWSLCDNGNTNPALPEALFGYAVGGVFSYSHALGGFAGSHAEYVRVPFAYHGAFTVPDELDDLTAVFASDAGPTGWMGAAAAPLGKGAHGVLPWQVPPCDHRGAYAVANGAQRQRSGRGRFVDRQGSGGRCERAQRQRSGHE